MAGLLGVVCAEGRTVSVSSFDRGTNVFAAPVTLNGGALMMSVSGPTVFAGGCTFNSKVTFTGTHGMPLIFRGKPVTSMGGFEFWNRRDIHFEVPSNKVSLAFNGKYSSPSTVHCWVDYAFHDYTSALTLTNAITVNLHGRTTSISRARA